MDSMDSILKRSKVLIPVQINTKRGKMFAFNQTKEPFFFPTYMLNLDSQARMCESSEQLTESSLLIDPQHVSVAYQ